MIKDKIKLIPFHCPCCGEHAHDIREDVTPTTFLNGEMFRKTQKMKDLNWTCFPEFDDQVGANLVCPYCEQQYTVTEYVHPESMPAEWREEHGL